MKTSHNNPDTLLLVMMKLSIFFLLCLAIVNAPRVKGQTIHLQGQKPFINPVQQNVQQIYTSQIGIREKGINTGPAVEQYLSYVKLPKGNPWCAAFICWVYGQAGVDNPRTGWSPALFPGSKVIWSRIRPARKTYNVKRTTPNLQPTTADIFALFFPEKKRIAHVGFIDQWDGNWMISVEGNTNEAGGREGDGVYRKRRLVRTVYQVARYVDIPD